MATLSSPPFNPICEYIYIYVHSMITVYPCMSICVYLYICLCIYIRGSALSLSIYICVYIYICDIRYMKPYASGCQQLPVLWARRRSLRSALAKMAKRIRQIFRGFGVDRCSRVSQNEGSYHGHLGSRAAAIHKHHTAFWMYARSTIKVVKLAHVLPKP